MSIYIKLNTWVFISSLTREYIYIKLNTWVYIGKAAIPMDFETELFNIKKQKSNWSLIRIIYVCPQEHFTNCQPLRCCQQSQKLLVVGKTSPSTWKDPKFWGKRFHFYNMTVYSQYMLKSNWKQRKLPYHYSGFFVIPLQACLHKKVQIGICKVKNRVC